MSRVRAGLAVAAVAAALAPAAADAQAMLCASREEFASGLFKKFREVPRVQAVTRDGSAFEIFVGPEGSWTVVVTRPNGVSCLTNAGDGFSVLAAPVKGEPS